MSHYRDHDVKAHGDTIGGIHLRCSDCGWQWSVGSFPVSVERDLAVRAREHQLHARRVDLGLVAGGA